MTENELATEAVDIAYQIHKELGPGLIESIYEEIFAYELRERNIAFTRQEKVIVKYKGLSFGKGFRTDLILDDKLIIELKSVETIEKVHHKMLLTYMRLKNIKLGLLINFKVNLIKDGIHRKIDGYL
ncbi:GxxExxY protein [Aquiflexum gelatinilyticum]|uniref:GxxExxY protein n=1 Tax=Aquiflexum gelatinilyticum TaxID=2961943 RepID=A0A9X2P9Y7_9BACT|nr:GxxExxY protein [Aquiflexum gelatinilyticum]MCR9017068.1 GxxExxY protein [Aquiflexum gelatinilyticum]